MALRCKLGTVRKNHHRKGFILLMVVLFILIISLTASAIASRAIASVAEARRLEEQLRDRWARISLQRALLERAERCFGQHEQKSKDKEQEKGAGVGYLDGSYTISGKTYRVRLADEQAKVNLVQGIRSGNAKQTVNAASGLGVRMRSDLAIRLESRIDRTISSDWVWPVRNWEVVLDGMPTSSVADLHELMLATSQVTLWGSGKLHWRRATKEAINAQRQLYEITSPVLIGTHPESLSNSQETQLHFGDTSDCFSLWILPEHAKTLSTFTVEWRNSGSTSEKEGFAW